MQIKLYYIEGISRVDTPYFSSFKEQADYFDTKLVKTIDNTYYPPFYKNTIKFDKDDCDFLTHINYLALVDDDKTYYYFITNMTYTNQGVMTLDIEMDSVQTYLFNTEFKSTTIERKFIDRWNGTSINRSYIRENISNGIFDKITKTFLDSHLWIIIKCSAYLYGEDSTFINMSFQQYHDKYYDTKSDVPSPFYYYFAPIDRLKYGNDYFDANLAIKAILNNDSVLGIYAVPFCPSDNININYSTNTISSYTNLDTVQIGTYTFESIVHNIYLFKGIIKVTSGITFTEYVQRLYEEDNSLPFYKNTALKTSFSSTNCPILLDENYYRIYFGDGGVKTSFPSYQFDKNKYYLYYCADIFSGYRYYKITNEEQSFFNDKFYTIQVNQSVLSYDLLNKPWNTYLATNKGTLLSGTLRSVENVGKLFLEYSSGDIVKGAIDTGKTINQISSTYASLINAKYSPNTIKQSGDYSKDFFSNSSRIFKEIQRVNDYNYCAQYYHHFGYLVKEYLNSTKSLADYVNTRYYFNYVKVSDIITHIDLLEADNITDKISQRYKDGVRFWNVLTNGIEIGDYQYDNIEKSYL